MNFNITSEAEAYIKQKGQAAMITMASSGGCCGGGIPIPHIEVGTPKNLALFETAQVNSVTIYFDKGFHKAKGIKIELEKLLCFKRLTIEFVE